MIYFYWISLYRQTVDPLGTLRGSLSKLYKDSYRWRFEDDIEFTYNI